MQAMTPDVILEGFAGHCSRMPLDRRPSVWAQHHSVWGYAVGEIGLPDVARVQWPQAVFAVVVPWVMVPSIGVVWVVVDALESMRVMRLGYDLDPEFWEASYSIDDFGRLRFGEPHRGPFDAFETVASHATKGRLEHIGWGESHTFDTCVPVIEHMLRNA